ncbi:Cyclin, C-terminal domain [Dillenia turbinata]|uniref:Cyclin, C-terminal domain n=1 Tax=Dillenia turbinata TaxID=194707 RepID=A0AAN8UV70_9MAGN
MVGSDENNSALLRPTNVPGGSEMGGNGKGVQEIRRNRRALSVISQNLVGGAAYPCELIKKKGLSDQHEICDKIPSNRPVTRRFAAQMAGMKQTYAQVTVVTKPSISKPSDLRESTFIYEDEEEEEDKAAAKDLPVPMALEDTEVVQNEVDQMEEVEMEDIFEEPVMDIDGCDIKNPLAVVDYVGDIYAHYRKIESLSCVAPDYMSQQQDINERMRAILIDWLIEVHEKFDLMKETLFLTVNLVDRFLARQNVPRKKLQLVGLVAMLLACKYEEVCVPIIGDLILISDKAYTRNEVIDMERTMLNTLQFNMSVATPYIFIKRFLKAAQSDKKLEILSLFMIELCLVEYEMLKFPPSLLAAAAIYVAHCTLYGFKQWSRTCEWHSNYSEDQLMDTARLIVGFHQKAANGKLTGVHRKYCSQKFVSTGINYDRNKVLDQTLLCGIKIIVMNNHQFPGKYRRVGLVMECTMYYRCMIVTLQPNHSIPPLRKKRN